MVAPQPIKTPGSHQSQTRKQDNTTARLQGAVWLQACISETRVGLNNNVCFINGKQQITKGW